MDRSEKRSVNLVLDNGTPLVLWQEPNAEGIRRGLFVSSYICKNPECDCRDIRLSATLIDDRYTNLAYDGKALTFNYVPRPGDPPERPPTRRLSAKLYVDSGEIEMSSDEPAEFQDAELLEMLRQVLTPHDLSVLRKQWRRTKGIGREDWRQKDWSWWKRGDMVSWFEVYPDDINLVFMMKGSTYLADDMYCINPGCSCREMGLIFSRIGDDGVENMGAARVEMPDCRFLGVMVEMGDENAIRRLWNTLRKQAGTCRTLRDRWQKMIPVGQEIVRLSAPSKPETVKVPVVKVGRNDPCPCGSGKKFKKCCL